MKLLGRIAVALAALVVVGWLAIGLRSAVLTKRGTEQLEEGLAAQQKGRPALRRAESSLDRATFLNPDRLPESYRAQVLVALGEGRRGRGLSAEVAREEPDNREIWATASAIGLALQDRAYQAEALRQLRRLNPRGAG